MKAVIPACNQSTAKGNVTSFRQTHNSNVVEEAVASGIDDILIIMER